MSNISKFVTAHGKRFEVEVIEPPERRAKKRQAFTQLSLEWAADMAKGAGIPGMMILVLLNYMHWKTKSTTFPLSNMLLAQYDISRETKRRILANLEKTGRIKLQRRNKRVILVTLLSLPK